MTTSRSILQSWCAKASSPICRTSVVRLCKGRRAGVFFYLCVGRCSLIAEPHWIGRVKVPLNVITWPTARQAVGSGGRLEARYTASRPDGRPVLASVKLLDDGWTVA